MPLCLYRRKRLHWRLYAAVVYIQAITLIWMIVEVLASLLRLGGHAASSSRLRWRQRGGCTFNILLFVRDFIQYEYTEHVGQFGGNNSQK